MMQNHHYYNTSSDDDDDAKGNLGCLFGSTSRRISPPKVPSSDHSSSSTNSGFWSALGGGRKRSRTAAMAASVPGGSSDGDGDDNVDPAHSLGKELAKLSFHERNAIAEEMHGVSSGAIIEEEDPGFVLKRVHQLYEEIQKIPSNQKEAYKKACFLAPTKFHHNLSFDLMFLRSTKFDSKAAARRIVDHFKYKHLLFGSEKLAKDITLDDLNEEDMKALKSGAFLVLATKDSAGRAVFFARMKFVDSDVKWQSIIRTNWYQAMTLIQGDESVQKLGAVMVDYSVDTTFAEMASIIQSHASSIPIYESWPMRQVSRHFCYNDPTINAALKLYLRLVPQESVVRFRYHWGDHMEVQYDVMSFGIPVSSIPIDQDGNKKQRVVMSCIQHLKELEPKEVSPSTQTSFVTPTTNHSFVIAGDKDVLLGRGVPIQSHPGNVYLTEVIDDRMEEFMRAPKPQKTVITWEIVDFIKKEVKGRFLEMDKDIGTWVVAQDASARSKVAVGFRSRMKKERKQQRDQLQKPSSAVGQNSSSTQKNDGGDDDMIIRTSFGQADKRIKLAR